MSYALIFPLKFTVSFPLFKVFKVTSAHIKNWNIEPRYRFIRKINPINSVQIYILFKRTIKVNVKEKNPFFSSSLLLIV